MTLVGSYMVTALDCDPSLDANFSCDSCGGVIPNGMACPPMFLEPVLLLLIPKWRMIGPVIGEFLALL